MAKPIKETIYWIPASIEPRKNTIHRLLLKHRTGIVYGWWILDGFYSSLNRTERYRLKTVRYYTEIKGPCDE